MHPPACLVSLSYGYSCVGPEESEESPRDEQVIGEHIVSFMRQVLDFFFPP